MDEALEIPQESPDGQPVHSLLNPRDEPQFGLIDVVEAFTALRHEYRSQIQETRGLAEQLDCSTQRIENLESKLTHFAETRINGDPEPDDQSDRFVQTLAEFDIQLSRAVEAAVADDQLRRSRQAERDEQLHQAIAGLSRISRWLAGPVIDTVRRHQIGGSNEPSTIADGLSILLTKLRQAIRDHQIERIETAGKPFDGEIMKSIGVLPVEGVPAGHVTQQLSAAYSRDNRIIKFAEVRIAP